jgi:hypothetical protein
VVELTWSYAWQPMAETSEYVRNLFPGDPAAASNEYCIKIQRLLREVGGRTKDNEVLECQSSCESHWFSCGCPYYKVTSGCYDALVRTSLDHCGFADIRVPFKAIAVRFPDDRSEMYPVSLVMRVGWDQWREVTRAAAAEDEIVNKRISGFAIDSLYVGLQSRETFAQHRTKRDRNGVLQASFATVSWPTRGVTTVGDLLRGGDSFAGDMASDKKDVFSRHLHVILGVLLLATHAHDEMFSSVLLRKDEQRYASADMAGRLRMVERAARLHRRRGWVVGGSLICPTIRDEKSDSGEPTGRHLDYRHWRAGHFHHVRHGKAHGLTKLVWFKPTIVRADLPEKVGAQRSYKV